MVANDWEMKAGEEWVNKAGRLGMKRYVLPIYNRLARGVRSGAQGEVALAATTVSCHAPSRAGSSMSPAASWPRSTARHATAVLTSCPYVSSCPGGGAWIRHVTLTKGVTDLPMSSATASFSAHVLIGTFTCHWR